MAILSLSGGQRSSHARSLLRFASFVKVRHRRFPAGYRSIPLVHRNALALKMRADLLDSMKTRNLFSCILSVFAMFPLLGASAESPETRITIEVLTTFDYPGEGNSTQPSKINDYGDVVGSFIDSSGVTRGFVRYRDGSFSAPIVEPNDTANVTQARAINNDGKIGGAYIGSDGAFHGYFLSGDTFTEFDVPGAGNTLVFGINNGGDFVGNTDIDATDHGYLSMDGVLTLFSIPGALETDVSSINDAQNSAGFYFDSAVVPHGFIRKRDGTLIFPIDPPGATQTLLFGNNDRGAKVGRYADSSGITHGLFFTGQNNFVTYDFPGATLTSLNGINQAGIICGRYQGADGIGHGIVARVRFRSGASSDQSQNPAAPARAINSSLSTLRSPLP